AHIRRHVEWAQRFARWVEASDQFELAAPAPLNLVCFRHRHPARDAFNRALLNRLNESGRLFLTHTELDGRFTLRFCVGQTHTEARHVEAAWAAIEETARTLEQSFNS